MIILGKTNTPEFGMSGTTENKLGDDCRNPWNPERVSGGSSGGTGSSIASGMNAVAQGSDGGGSIRIPSAFCGIYGIKATQGRVPRLHVGMGSWHPVNFSCMGPMSRTVRDSALLLQVMSGPHPEAEHGTIQDEPADYAAALDRGVAGLRIGWSAGLRRVGGRGPGGEGGGGARRERVPGAGRGGGGRAVCHRSRGDKRVGGQSGRDDLRAVRRAL